MALKMNYNPYEYQKLIIDMIKEKRRCNIWAGMGMGKTSSTATAIHELNAYPTLVVAPKRVALSTWPAEYEKWGHLQGVKVAPVIGTPRQRSDALLSNAEVFTINYENLPWLYEQGFNCKTIVADESTRLKSFRTRRKASKKTGKLTVKPSYALAKMTCQATRHINLTGTPSPLGLTDLWGPQWFIDQGERLGKSFKAFTDRWFRAEQVGASRFAVKYTPWPHAEQEITEALQDVSISIMPEDYLPIGEPIYKTLHAEMPAKAWKLYNQMEKDLFFEIGSAEIEAPSAAAKLTKCLQIAAGFVYDEFRSPIDLHDGKIDVLKSVVEEANGAPILVSYWWQHDLNKILKAFPQAVALGDDPSIIRKWNAGKIPILVAHPASCGHGLNLQDGGNILVFYSDWYNLEAHQQIIERIGPTRQFQSGHNRPTFVYSIVTEGTVDEEIAISHERKATLQELLIKRMKK